MPDKCVHIGTDLTQEERDWLIDFLHESKNIFAWSANDLQGVSRELAQHNLNAAQGSKPRNQKLRKMSTERAVAGKAEVNRRLDAGVIKLVQYLEWLPMSSWLGRKMENGQCV